MKRENAMLKLFTTLVLFINASAWTAVVAFIIKADLDLTPLLTVGITTLAVLSWVATLAMFHDHWLEKPKAIY